jgi:hypothetical protein
VKLLILLLLMAVTATMNILAYRLMAERNQWNRIHKFTFQKCPSALLLHKDLEYLSSPSAFQSSVHAWGLPLGVPDKLSRQVFLPQSTSLLAASGVSSIGVQDFQTRLCDAAHLTGIAVHLVRRCNLVWLLCRSFS